MTAYYNENDPFAAAWLRELIKANLIAPGEVDERSIEEVKPDDLRRLTQCHFFAGIGVWSYALRAAGWPDDLAVWTGSCPCQGFSQSGKGEGFSDKRHLWPAWFRLISECAPDTILGEQVSGKDGLAWFDVVSADLEASGYAIGAIDSCAAGVGAPHIRQRLYFVADSTRSRSGSGLRDREPAGERRLFAANNSNLGQPFGAGLEGHDGHGDNGNQSRRNGAQPARSTAEAGIIGEPAHPEHARFDRSSTDAAEQGGNEQANGLLVGGDSGLCATFWSEVEWLFCKDGKYRPTQPGLSPLAHGITNRVGKLRGYGNALCAPQAQAFIEAYMSLRFNSVVKADDPA